MTHVISLCDSDVVRCFTEWFEPVLRYGDHPLKTDQGQQVSGVLKVINRLERSNHVGTHLVVYTHQQHGVKRSIEGLWVGG